MICSLPSKQAFIISLVYLKGSISHAKAVVFSCTGEHSPRKGKQRIMQVKINQEIREYTETIFFGLSPRQFFFSLFAVIVAVALYFLLRNSLSTETVSWVCVIGAAPFAAMGFFRYHGMTFEKFLWVFLRSELLEPRIYLFKPRNHFAEITKEYRREQTRSQRKQKNKVGRIKVQPDISRTIGEEAGKEEMTSNV